MEWIRIEYNMPNMGPHWHDGGKTQKEVLSGRWKEHHEVFIPEYVAEEYEDFNDGVLMYTNGGLMDEINENLKNCPTHDDRVRYIISLLQPFKEFAAAFYAKEQIDERKRAIVECQKDMKSWENVAEDAVDERTGKLLEPAKQIEACKQFIDEYEQDIKYWKQVEEDFFWLAQHGLGAGGTASLYPRYHFNLLRINTLYLLIYEVSTIYSNNYIILLLAKLRRKP